MKKLRLSVYVAPELMVQLTELADRKRQPKSLLAEAAILSFLTPGDVERRDGALVRRLDRLSRQTERVEHNLSIIAETLALYVRFWLMVTPPLPDTAQLAAHAKGRERFESFLEALGRRLAKGHSILREVSLDRLHDSASPVDPSPRSHEAQS